MTAICAGVIVTDAAGVPACQDQLGAPLAWQQVPQFTASALEADQLAGAFAAGFVIVGTAWAIGKGFQILLSMLR